MFRVSIVIVTYHSEATIVPCLSSVPGGVEVIVVDNGSTDATASIVEGFPNVRLIRSENRGFGAGCNLGVSHATGEILVLLNPDATLAQDSLEILLESLASHPQAGVLAPRILDPEGQLELSWGKTPGILSEWRRKWEHRNPPKAPSCLMKADWVSGACMMIPKTAWDSVGGFDESYFLYFEDVDLCRRFVAKGWDVMFEPRASIAHQRGHSSNQVSRATEIWYRQSQRRFYQKHADPLQRLLLWCYLACKYAHRALSGDSGARQILAKAPDC